MVKVTVERSLASHIPDELLNHSVEMGVLTFRPDDRCLRRSLSIATNWLSWCRRLIRWPGRKT